MFEYIVDPSKTITKIIAERPTNINYFTKKLTFYNPLAKEPLHKFWYMIPSATITNKNKNTCVAALSPIYTEIITSINNLDGKVNEAFNLPQTKSIINENIFFPCLTLHLTNNTKCFDKNGTIKNDFVQNTCMLIIEYTCVLVSRISIVRKWTLIQAKEIPSIDMSVDLFDKFNKVNCVNNIVPIPPPPVAHGMPLPMLPPPLPAVAPKLQAAELKPVEKKYIPTQDELKNMIGRLKKTIDPDIKNEINELMKKSVSEYDHCASVLELDGKIFMNIANGLANCIQ